MKIIKKISILLMALCLTVPCFSMIAHAADGRIAFTDPSTAVGDMVELKCVVRLTSGTLGNTEVKLTYDSQFLRFESGDGVTADGDGALTCSGTGGAAEATFNLKFQALQEGTTDIQVADAAVVSSSGSAYTLDKGSSKVTIAAGDPSKIEQAAATSVDDVKVTVGETEYTLTDNFKDSDVPAGYTKTTVSFEGKERQMVSQDSGAVTLGYLVDADAKGEFFLFNEEDASFTPYEEVAISDSVSIIPLSNTSKVELPSGYQKVTLTLNGKDYPVWQDGANEGYYVMYAVNNSGEKGFYRYDSKEDTYQRFVAPSEESAKKDTSSTGKIKSLIADYSRLLLIIVGVGALIVLIIIVMLAVKLRNRNAELDDLYDEYGIDMDEEPREPVTTKKTGKPAVRVPSSKSKHDEEFDDEDLEDDFDIYNEDDLEEDEYDDEFAEVEYEDYDNEEYRSEQDTDIDDLDELLGQAKKKKRGHTEDDDTFKVDFIDLD